MKEKVVIYTLALGLSLLVLTGCSGKEETSTGAKGLNIQFVPTNNNGLVEAKAKLFTEYLSGKLGCKVDVTLATDYFTIVGAMTSEKVDIGIISLAAYVQARDRRAAQAILALQLGAYSHEAGLPEEGKFSGTFKGEVLVKTDSGLQTLEDLKDKRTATLSPNSVSGYIYPTAEMKDLGIDLTKDCTLTTINDIPSETIAVLNGQQDACFVSKGARSMFASKFSDHGLLKDLRVLYLAGGDTPDDAVAVQIDIEPELKEKVKKVFLNMEDDEVGQETMSLWDHKGYEEANDSVYDTVKGYTAKAAE